MNDTVTDDRPKRYFSPATREKLSIAAKERWARLREERDGDNEEERHKHKLPVEIRAKISASVKSYWAARRVAKERETRNIRDQEEASAHYKQEYQERRFHWLRESAKALDDVIGGFSLHHGKCPESVQAVVGPMIDAGKIFAKAAVELRLGRPLDITKCYFAHANSVIYTLHPERQGDWEYWRFRKIIGDKMEGPDGHMMINSLPDWFEWLRVPYDLDWHEAPVTAEKEVES